MKLAAIAFATMLGLGGIASADPAGPPPPPAVAAPRPHDQLHQLLLERFDRNHDGHLDAQERHRAVRALRRLARRMAIQDRREGQRDEVRARREARLRELVKRYDRNGDGVVTPDEMPPGVARRLQRLDRNRDGWLDERDEH